MVRNLQRRVREKSSEICTYIYIYVHVCVCVDAYCVWVHKEKQTHIKLGTISDLEDSLTPVRKQRKHTKIYGNVSTG